MRLSPKALKRPRVLFLLSLLCLLLLFVPGAAGGSKRSGKVILIVLDQTSLAELNGTRLPNIRRLVNGGAIGAMNVRTPTQDSVSAGYVTVGAGGKAVGTPGAKQGLKEAEPEPWEGFGADEMIEGRRASDIYRQRTGRMVRAPSIANLSISQISEANREEDLGTRPGALGDALHSAGLKTAVLGNSDTKTVFGRSAVDLVMDGRGLVDLGYVGRDMLTADATFPTGVRTDPARLLAGFKSAYAKADVIAIEWGDTSRVEAERSYLTAGMAAQAKGRALQGADRFLGSLLKGVDMEKDTIIIVSPNTPAEAVKQESLMTPTVMAGYGVGRGLLTTPTTRRDGVLVNIDIAPTVLALLGREVPAEMVGQSLTAVAFDGDALDYLDEANDSWVARAQVDAPVLRVFAAWDVIIISLFMLLLLLPAYRGYARGGRMLLMTVPAAVLSLMILPMFRLTTVASVSVALIGLTALLVLLVRWQAKGPLDPLIVVGLAAVAAVMIDLAAGSDLANRSLIGPSVITGARFYGLGNEFGGVLVGSTLIASTALLERLKLADEPRRRIGLAFIGLFMIAVAVVIGHPALGANFGMLLAALAAFGITLLGFIRGRIGWRELASLAAVSLLIIAGVFIYDISRGAGAESHIGRLVGSIGTDGLRPLWQVIERKVAMNVRLIQFAFWNWVNIASLGVLLVSAYALRGLIRGLSARYQHYKWALIGGIVGCVASLAFNDSGVVAMAMIFLFLVPATLYLMTAETGT